MKFFKVKAKNAIRNDSLSYHEYFQRRNWKITSKN